MRIDGTSGIEPRGASDAGRQVQHPKAAVPLSTAEETGKLGQTGNSEYVRKALACPDVDAQAVDRARKLLESGALDTEQAALDAAEAMLNSGI